MRQFVSDHAFEFIVIHQLKQTLRHSNRSMARVSSGSKGIGRRFRNDIKFRQGQIRLCSKAFHDGVEAGKLLPRYGLCAAGHQGDFVREKVSKSIHHRGESEAHGHAVTATEVLPDQHKKERQSCEQKCCSKDSHSFLLFYACAARTQKVPACILGILDSSSHTNPCRLDTRRSRGLFQGLPLEAHDILLAIAIDDYMIAREHSALQNLQRQRILNQPLNRARSEEHTSELQSQFHLVCRLLLEKKKKKRIQLSIIIK